MNFIESIRMALRVLRGHPMRSALTMLGVIVGVAAVVALVSAGEGARNEVSEIIRELGTDVLYVLPGPARTSGVQRAVGTQHTLSEDDVGAIWREMPEVLVASPIVQTSVQIIAAGNNWSTTVYGTNSEYLWTRDWSLVEGRTFSNIEMESGAKVAIIGQVIAEKLFNGSARVGDTFRIDHEPFTVIGILEKKGQTVTGFSQDDIAIVPLMTARRYVLGANRHALTSIAVKIVDPSAMSDSEAKLKQILRRRHSLREGATDDFNVFSPTDLLTAQEKAIRDITTLIALIASIALIVGGISITNIMLVSVTERTREIGLRMAVGARRRDIRNQFLVEAIIIAFIGGSIGAAIGCIIAEINSFFRELPVLISPSLVLIACGVATLVGLVAGSYPAHRASKLEPMVALRFE